MATSEVFEDNDRKVRELLANLVSKCTSARLLLEEEKKVRVCEIAGESDEAEGLIRKMELEARSLKKAVKAKVVVMLGEYGNDVKKLKTELGYSNQRGRLVTSIDDLKESGERMAEYRETMLEEQLVELFLMGQPLHY